MQNGVNDFRGKKCQSDCSNYIGGIFPDRSCQFYGVTVCSGVNESLPTEGSYEIQNKRIYQLFRIIGSDKGSVFPPSHKATAGQAPVTLQAASANYPLQFFANGIFVIFWMTFEITS